MPLDINTLAIFLGLVNIMQVLALFTQYKVDNTHSGPGWWTTGTALCSMAFALSFLRDFAALSRIVIVANYGLLCCSFSVTYVGFLRFMGQRVPGTLLFSVCATVILAESWFTYGHDNQLARRIVVSLALVSISLAIVRTMLVNNLGRVALASRYLLCAVFLLEICLVVAVPATSSAGLGLISPYLTNVMIYLGTVITTTLWAFGVILLVNQRLIAERERTIHELNGAIEQIRTLKGILPICSGCKKIRDDRGYWEQVESFVSRHSEAEFTHGMCPECMGTLYAGFSGSRTPAQTRARQ